MIEPVNPTMTYKEHKFVRGARVRKEHTCWYCLKVFPKGTEMWKAVCNGLQRHRRLCDSCGCMVSDKYWEIDRTEEEDARANTPLQSSPRNRSGRNRS